MVTHKRCLAKALLSTYNIFFCCENCYPQVFVKKKENINLDSPCYLELWYLHTHYFCLIYFEFKSSIASNVFLCNEMHLTTCLQARNWKQRGYGYDVSELMSTFPKIRAYFRYYSIYPKDWGTLSSYHTYPKIWNSPFYYLLMWLKYYCMYG